MNVAIFIMSLLAWLFSMHDRLVENKESPLFITSALICLTSWQLNWIVGVHFLVVNILLIALAIKKS